jgi:hypothetical protein
MMRKDVVPRREGRREVPGRPNICSSAAVLRRSWLRRHWGGRQWRWGRWPEEEACSSPTQRSGRVVASLRGLK